MKSEETFDVIASRDLRLGETLVTVRLGRPEAREDDYLCEYSIRGSQLEKLGHAFGTDSIQALQLAMTSVGIDLQLLKNTTGQDVSWLDDTPGATGFCPTWV